ncbi:FecR domain-containing protein [Vibrio splendidus]|uniref:FecR domain-containing protein n=1 Tax=Vibrio splendidus TaxID=29497 RepID=UPI0024696E5A|nr:FecR domain-containing protein [Vibrio splendidus]MDH5910632.1 FecR domain-containing protein [Vibrio splendidus]MDH5940744.1 FecR domain-containing protein [Vibrio splendidus]MDH5983490.1 FecR domain-containing protein [Vibrio splendidus]MDH5992769.1 FecR domain-containing protein [Vibrio splendidus]MDH6003925.1 FecR domain-containing protein [Vibrio splendidus]
MRNPVHKLTRETLTEASNWMARLWADDVTQQDQDAFLCWKNAHPQNAEAWKKLELIQNKFANVPQSDISRQILTPKKSALSRRDMLMLSGLSFTSLAVGISTYRTAPKGVEYATATGEMKSVILSDGTEIALNTASQIYVEFNQHHRQLHLVTGEVLITNSHHRTPLSVSTIQGRVLPLGTQFTVREHDAATEVCVYEGEVKLQPMLGMGTSHILAGHQASFNRRTVSSIERNKSTGALWLSQKILAEATPLIEFINELSRYRRGILNIDPSLKDLKLTGIFSTSNIDQTLYNISQILPIKIQYRTPFWVTIKPKY